MMGLFPILIVTAAGVLLLLAFSLEKVISSALANKVIKRKHSISVLVALVVMWLLSCLMIVISSGLSHSEKIKDLMPARCLLLFLVLVVLPGVSLFLLQCRISTKESEMPKLKRVSILVYAILISLIFFFSAKSGMWPPLAVTTKYNFNRISQLLIKMGIDVNEEDVYGYAPLWYAARKGDLATTELLLERGADFHKWGVGAFGEACINDHRDVAELLINRGVHVDAIVNDYIKWTALMAATNAGHLDVIKMLVRKGASVDMRDKDGKTALMIAQGRRQIKIAEFLKATQSESVKRNSE